MIIREYLVLISLIMVCLFIQVQDTKMNEFDSSLIDACDVLRDMKDEHTKCLEEFINCKKLIGWLRKSMESKTFHSYIKKSLP